MNGNFEQKIVSDLGLRYFLAIDCANLHLAGRWWAGVGDSSGRRNHANVKSKGHCALSSIVYAFDVVSTGAIRDEFRMFLNNEDERRFAIDVHKPAGVEKNFEINGLTGVAIGNNSTTVFVLAVALYIDYAIEVV